MSKPEIYDHLQKKSLDDIFPKETHRHVIELCHRMRHMTMVIDVDMKRNHIVFPPFPELVDDDHGGIKHIYDTYDMSTFPASCHAFLVKYAADDSIVSCIPVSIFDEPQIITSSEPACDILYGIRDNLVPECKTSIDKLVESGQTIVSISVDGTSRLVSGIPLELHRMSDDEIRKECVEYVHNDYTFYCMVGALPFDGSVKIHRDIMLSLLLRAANRNVNHINVDLDVASRILTIRTGIIIPDNKDVVFQ